MLLRIALVLKDKELETAILEQLAQSNVLTECFGHLKNPFQEAIHTNSDIFVLSDDLLPDPIESAVAQINNLPETPTTIVLHNDNSAEAHAKLVALGADVVLYSGLRKKTLIEAVETSIESRRQLVDRPLTGERSSLLTRLDGFASQSPRMRILMEMIEKIIISDTQILILGETGVGKEYLARIIHAESNRTRAPFVAVNCAALPEQLLESELFGHEEGAFTGAIRQRRGAFEMAHGGTILLDEIGELPPHLQAKLLRILQDYEVRPVGSEKSIWVDVRVIATTNREIEREIENGNFRKDLYYRLSVLSMTVPPLRERREDIPFLTNHYIKNFNTKLNKSVSGISKEAMDMLTGYSWPGNVRELINVIERAMILSRGDRLTPDDLPSGIQGKNADGSFLGQLIDLNSEELKGRTLPEVREQVIEKLEESYLRAVLAETDGRIGDAARCAGIHPRGFYDKMKRYGLRKEDFKSKSSGK